MQITRHWRLNGVRYRLEGIRYPDGTVSLQPRPLPLKLPEIQVKVDSPAVTEFTQMVIQHVRHGKEGE